MNKRDMVRLLADGNKAYSRAEISLALGARDEFSALDVGWITKKLQGEDTNTPETKSHSEIIEFAEVNEHVKNLARDEGLEFKGVDLLKLMTAPKFSSFVASRGPLRCYKNILAVSDMLIKELKETTNETHSQKTT